MAACSSSPSENISRSHRDPAAAAGHFSCIINFISLLLQPSGMTAEGFVVWKLSDSALSVLTEVIMVGICADQS